MKKITILFLLIFMRSNANAQAWENVGGGITDNVYDMINYNGELFAGGRFAGKVKSWNGTNWTNYPPVFGIASPLSFSICQDTLYTGGDYPGQGTQSRVSKFVNGSWEQVGGVFDHPSWSSTKKLVTFDNLLISGGRFHSIGGVPIYNIAAWDGIVWGPMGAGFNSMVTFLEVHNNTLYASGSFTASGTNSSVKNLARWNGTSWECFDTSVVFTTAYALKSYQGDLLIGNVWNTISGIDMNGIARWDGMNYTSMGDSLIKAVHEFHEFNNELYMAADLIGSNAWTTKRAVLKWTGSNWIQVGEEFNEWIMCLESYGNQLYCGGQYSSPTSHIARFNEVLEINELQQNERKRVKIVDLMGNETTDKLNTVLIYIYEDGTTEKVFHAE
jgi:hypothetical protein